MEFKIGYSVKPKEITTFNKVVFEEYQIVEGTERLVDVLPTKDECLGYNFNYYDNKCWTLSENQFIDIDGVFNYGSNNATSFNNTNSIILGSDNNLSQGGANDLIVGDYNNIDLNTRNSIVFGTYGDASATNSIVLGGNSNNDILGERQSIMLMYGGTTTNDATTNLYLNNILNKYFDIPINTAMIFNADILGLRVGGTGAGAVGDYASWIERGVIINKNGVITANTTNTPIVSSGTTTGWIAGVPIGNKEVIANGSFATDTIWGKASGWSISNGAANRSRFGTNSAIYQNINLVAGRLYNISYTRQYTSGNSQTNLFSEFINKGANITLGTYRGTERTPITVVASFTPNYSGVMQFRVYGIGDFTGSITNVSVIEQGVVNNFGIDVVGARDTNIEWASTINFTQIKTNITL